MTTKRYQETEFAMYLGPKYAVTGDVPPSISTLCPPKRTSSVLTTPARLVTRVSDLLSAFLTSRYDKS